MASIFKFSLGRQHIGCNKKELRKFHCQRVVPRVCFKKMMSPCSSFINLYRLMCYLFGKPLSMKALALNFCCSFFFKL